MLLAFWGWLFSSLNKERPSKTPIERLELSIRVTAKCRYNAAARLDWQSKFSFFTTTFLSLGLVLIPLLQNSGVRLVYSPSVLNMMSIFLAVAVLVYSIVIATARYDVRSENLTDCGNKLKELNRSLARDRARVSDDSEILDAYQQRYSDIVTDTENHSRDDYAFAMLEMRRDYNLTGLSRARVRFETLVQYVSRYVVPSSMILIEMLFIFDMIGFTSFFSPYLS
ncbi:hypothetical protein DCO49_12080 [Stenotrophomonas sp. SPM]|uniref:SLATT domain-containing protein n=1 Tax=Stenotrophomonas sp. SPM TaxID=2170735 RepID=UPI000DE771C3|nr:SLATT domain-containing protein [Stenotrophomonas sp. SPM]PWB24448.1 hypothetical protein DCO49_12080 [Stenotrophomonas sp. SPM]